LILKRLGLLKEMLPSASRIAALWHPDAFGERRMKEVLSEAEAVARAMGVHLQPVEVRGPDELDVAFSAVIRERPNALDVFPSTALFYERRRIVEFAAKQRLPTMYFVRDFVASDGLISYGPSITDPYRRSASYVDKILKGAKPGDLPIEQPTKFELVINLKTAKALGITVPQSLLVRADEVIQ
jgi:putative ABC transport system substrate-binding protein